MKKPRLSWLVTTCAALACFTGARAAERTSVVVNPTMEGADYQARYSQAVLLQAALRTAAGPVAGERVSFFVSPEDAPDAGFLVDDPVTDATGIATARLTFVDGRHGGQTFAAAEPPGARYVIEARFAGEIPAEAPACQPTDGGVLAVDGGPTDAGAGPLCGSQGNGAVWLTPENVELRLQPGARGALGDEIRLIATVVDKNGNAPVGGLEIDGNSERPVAGATVSFFFDLDQNERPSLDERVGTAETDADGIAVLDFVADPAFYPAGDFAAGIQVQFAGDARYALAGASGRIVLENLPVDPARTIIETDPPEAPADGNTRIALSAQLVDEAGNALSVETDAYPVYFTSTLGLVEGDAAERDLLSGKYTQTLRAPDEGGEATITVFVDDVEGASVQYTFTSQGCACSAGRPSPADVARDGLWLALLGVLRKRRRAR